MLIYYLKNSFDNIIVTMVPDKRVYMICLHPVDRTISWHTHRIPEGLEGFWELNY